MYLKFTAIESCQAGSAIAIRAVMTVKLLREVTHRQLIVNILSLGQ